MTPTPGLHFLTNWALVLARVLRGAVLSHEPSFRHFEAYHGSPTHRRHAFCRLPDPLYDFLVFFWIWVRVFYERHQEETSSIR